MKVIEHFFAGRLTRSQYIKRYLLAILIFFVATFVAAIYLGITSSFYESTANSELIYKSIMMPMNGYVYFLGILLSLATISFDIRRIRDIGLDSRWIALPIGLELFSLVPAFEDGAIGTALTLAYIALIVYLCLAKSQENDLTVA